MRLRRPEIVVEAEQWNPNDRYRMKLLIGPQNMQSFGPTMLVIRASPNQHDERTIEVKVGQWVIRGVNLHDVVDDAVILRDYQEVDENTESDHDTVRVLAAMLGWVNQIPPRRVLEAEIRALIARVQSFKKL